MLEEYLRSLGVWFRFVSKDETIHTRDAARAIGVEPHKVTKNLVSQTDRGEYVLLVVPGDMKVDLKAAADALGVGNVKLVSFEEAERVSGYPPGGTPTLGHRAGMRVILDSSILDMETFYCGGGARDRLLELKPHEVQRVTRAVVAKIGRTVG